MTRKEIRLEREKQRRKKYLKSAKYVVAFAICAVLIGVFANFDSTFAWFHTDDKKQNQFEASVLKADIIGYYGSKKDWVQGNDAKRVVQVRNNGSMPTYVRVSLEESIALFKIDLNDGEGQGNGDLKVFAGKASAEIQSNDPSTWEAGKELSANDGNNHYRVEKSAVNQKYLYEDTGRNDLFEPFIIFLNNSKIEKVWKGKGNDSPAYWLYEKGYFYYSELLQPGEKTEILVNNLKLSDRMPNAYKACFYNLVPKMEAHDNTESVKDSWNLSEFPEATKLFNHKTYNK